MTLPEQGEIEPFYMDTERLDFEPFDWTAPISLLPGTYMRFTRDERVSLFECRGLPGGRITTGRLVRTNAGQLVEQFEEATLSLVHPVGLMADAKTPHVEFTIQLNKTTKTNITLPTVEAEIAFDPELNRAIIADIQRRQVIEPFINASAQSILNLAAGHLLNLAAAEPEGSSRASELLNAHSVINDEFILLHPRTSL